MALYDVLWRWKLTCFAWCISGISRRRLGTSAPPPQGAPHPGHPPPSCPAPRAPRPQGTHCQGTQGTVTPTEPSNCHFTSSLSRGPTMKLHGSRHGHTNAAMRLSETRLRYVEVKDVSVTNSKLDCNFLGADRPVGLLRVKCQCTGGGSLKLETRQNPCGGRRLSISRVRGQ